MVAAVSIYVRVFVLMAPEVAELARLAKNTFRCQWKECSSQAIKHTKVAAMPTAKASSAEQQSANNNTSSSSSNNKNNKFHNNGNNDK